MTMLCISDDKDDRLRIHDTEKWEHHTYIQSTGIEENIRFVFTMSPLMTNVAVESDFAI